MSFLKNTLLFLVFVPLFLLVYEYFNVPILTCLIVYAFSDLSNKLSSHYQKNSGKGFFITLLCLIATVFYGFAIYSRIINFNGFNSLLFIVLDFCTILAFAGAGMMNILSPQK